MLARAQRSEVKQANRPRVLAVAPPPALEHGAPVARRGLAAAAPPDDALQRALATAVRRRVGPAPQGRLLQRMFVLEEDQRAAANALQTGFPSLTIEGKLGADDDVFWKKYMHTDGQPLSLAQFITSLLGFLQPSQRPGMTIRLFHESTGLRVKVEGTATLSDEDPKKRPFSMNQEYTGDGERLNVKLETVVAPGHGRQFVSAMLAQARALKVRHLKLDASSIGGSQEGVFVWARYGYTPSDEDWKTMRSWGLTKLDESQVQSTAAVEKGSVRDVLGQMSGELKEKLRRILLDPSPMALRRLVHLSWKDKTVTGFLNPLLASGFSWKGELDLDDAKSLEWIKTYAAGAKIGVDLLPAESGEQRDPRQQEVALEEDEPLGSAPEEDIGWLAASVAESAAEDREEMLAELRRDYGKWEGFVDRVLEEAAALQTAK